MVYYKTNEEIELIRQNCMLVSKTLSLVAFRYYKTIPIPQ